jgi:nucleoid DNA-binding protein
MEYLIAPTLFQKKNCRLPGIGTLSLKNHPAVSNIAAAVIKAPEPFISFSPVNESDENVFNEFTALSELIKNDIEEKGTVTLKGVGDFIKRENGAIDFLPSHIHPLFMPDVTATRVIRQYAEHTILVGDKETTSTQMSGYFGEAEETEAPAKGSWWIWAIVLVAVGLAVVGMYLLQNGFNLFGNVVNP